MFLLEVKSMVPAGLCLPKICRDFVYQRGLFYQIVNLLSLPIVFGLQDSESKISNALTLLTLYATLCAYARPPPYFFEVDNASLRRCTFRQQCRTAFCFLWHPLRSIRLAGDVSTVRKQVRK